MNDDGLKALLGQVKRVAIVGLSNNWNRPSNFVGKYLLEHGYDVVPVNPRYQQVFDLQSYPAVTDIPGEVDLVNCFRQPDALGPVLEDVLRKDIKRLWLQIGVVNYDIKKQAEDYGLEVVMDRCIKIEHARLFGGLNFVGVNTKIISSKRSKQVYN